MKSSNEKQQLLGNISQMRYIQGMCSLVFHDMSRNDSASQQHLLHKTQQELQQYQLTLERSDRMRSELETTLQSEIK